MKSIETLIKKNPNIFNSNLEKKFQDRFNIDKKDGSEFFV